MFAEEQLYVLRKSALVNGIRFPLWDEDVAITYDTRSVLTPPPGMSYADPAAFSSRHPALSPEQQRNSATWRRLDGGEEFVASSPLEPHDIVQHIVTDCSVCGSIAVCICHNRRFQTQVRISSNVLAQSFSLRWRLQLGWSSLHLAESGQSAQEPSSNIYHVRLLFNGAYRRVGAWLLILMALRSPRLDMCE